MIVLSENTKFKIDTSVTNNNLGIKEDDKWCLINITIENLDFNYTIKEEILTLNEIKNTISILEDFLCDKIKNTRITYIKNYLKLKLITTKKIKTLELTLIEPKNVGNNTYKLSLTEKEINKIIEEFKKVL